MQPIGNDVMSNPFTPRAGPYCIRKMAIIFETGNDMPMKVGNLIPEGRHVDFPGMQDIAQCIFDGPYHGHQFPPILFRQIRHLRDVAIPDDPARGRVSGFWGQDYAAVLVLPHDLLACRATQRTMIHIFSTSFFG